MPTREAKLDRRGGKIALVAHCILNQNARAQGLAKRTSAIDEIVAFLMKKGIGILQLPCPELAHVGASRLPRTKEQFNTLEYRSLCRKLAEDIVSQVLQYKKCGVRLELAVGVEGSPTCAVNGSSGFLMEELQSVLKERGVSASFFAVDVNHLKRSLAELGKLLK